MKPKIISLVGLTASGKSAIGIKLAQIFNGEIISCDSRQVYRGLDIGTAKVTTQEQKLVRHHLIDVVEPPQNSPSSEGVDAVGGRGSFDVYEFQQRAYAAIDDILKRGKLPILVGGTGLYSRSIVEGYDFKHTPPAVAGTPLPERGTSTRYEVLQICLLPSKEFIHPLVEQRIELRLQQGMIQETKDLIAKGVSKQWLQKLGLEYFWNVEYIDGRVTLDEYKKQLATKTMQFAKRQKTWFKKEKNTVYLTDPETFLNTCIKLTKEFTNATDN